MNFLRPACATKALFSNSPVKWRFTKVVLPTPPSPTRINLNSGISMVAGSVYARRLCLLDNLSCFGRERLAGVGVGGRWCAGALDGPRRGRRVRGARAAFVRGRGARGEFWASLFYLRCRRLARCGDGVFCVRGFDAGTCLCFSLAAHASPSAPLSSFFRLALKKLAV